MMLDEKEKELLDVLSSANSVLSVKEIAKRLFVSEPTARRRLALLAKKNYIVRTHGGAIINYNMAQNKTIPLYLRISNMSDGKTIIAKKAMRLIKDNSVIFLDGSSTAFHLVPLLKQFHDITVCTNSLKTAITLAEMDIKAICLGGDVNSSNLACISHDTLDMIEKLNANILFFSCDALSQDGILSDTSSEASALRIKYMKNAEIKVLLIDNTKLNKKCWHNICSVKDLDYCICNTQLPENIKTMLKHPEFNEEA